MSGIKQAMVLSAGLSTRMRPLTDKLPKILLPILGKTHFQRTSDYLASQGIEQIALNSFHCKDQLKKLESDFVRIFPEEPIRGTGGGILGMKSFVTSDHFAVLNCDFLTDLDLYKMFAYHVASKALATLYLPPLPPKAKYGGVAVDKTGRIEAFRSEKSNVFFGGVHILSKEIFDHFPKDHEFCIVRNVYEPLLQKKAPIFGYTDKSRWIDFGEIRLYHRGLFEVLQKPLFFMNDVTPDTSWVHPKAEVYEDVTSKNIVVEENATIAQGTILIDSVVFPGTRLKAGDYRKMILTSKDQIQL